MRLTSRVQSLEPMYRWKETNGSTKLSSNLHIGVIASAPPTLPPHNTTTMNEGHEGGKGDKGHEQAFAID